MLVWEDPLNEEEKEDTRDNGDYEYRPEPYDDSFEDVEPEEWSDDDR